MSQKQAGASAALAEHATAIRSLGKRVIDDIVEIGRRLADCRDNHLDHGQWLPWLKREFQWSRQTANNFINVYEAGPKLPNFSNLGLPISSLYLLAAPSTPEEVGTEIIERVEGGEKVPHAEVKRLVEDHKAERRLEARGLVRSTKQKTAPAPRKVDRRNPKIADKHADRVIFNITVALDTVDDLLAIDKLSDREGFEQHLRALAARMLALADRVVASAHDTVRADVEATLPESAAADPTAEVYGPFDPFALIPVPGGDRRTKVAS